ncbi:MAG: hypothetical protein U5L06_12100 [Rhodovibrio sp.]|nr:hypothetical protein [Rhodovibrio sp.]
MADNATLDDEPARRLAAIAGGDKAALAPRSPAWNARRRRRTR